MTLHRATSSRKHLRLLINLDNEYGASLAHREMQIGSLEELLPEILKTVRIYGNKPARQIRINIDLGDPSS